MRFTIALFVTAVLTILPGHLAVPQTQQTRYFETDFKLVAEISPQAAFPAFTTVYTQAFTLSPDGARLFVQFDGLRKDAMQETWLAVWDTSSKALIKSVRIGGPVSVPKTVDQVAVHRNVQITTDAKKLVVTVGGRLLILDAAGLDLIHEITAAIGKSPGEARMEFAHTEIARNAGVVLAVASGPAYPKGPAEARLFDINSGEKLAAWDIQAGSPQTIHLSPDGREALMIPGNPVSDVDILLLDATTGKILQSISSGYRIGRSFGAGNAEFLNDGNIIVTPAFPTDRRGRYAGNELKIINSSEKRIIAQIAPPRFGPVGQLQVSSTGDRFETESEYLTHRQITGDRIVPADTSYLLFDANNLHEAYRVRFPHLRVAKDSGYFRVRFSADLEYAAMIYNDPISIFRVVHPGTPAASR